MQTFLSCCICEQADSENRGLHSIVEAAEISDLDPEFITLQQRPGKAPLLQGEFRVKSYGNWASSQAGT